MVEDSQQAAERITSLFTRVMMRGMTIRSLIELKSEGLSLSQLQCLRYLMQHGKCRLGQVSEGLAVSGPAATKLIDRLVRKGLVSNSPCASDRRSADIDLTEEGRRLIESFRTLRLQRLQAILDRMEAEDRKSLFQGLDGFIQAAMEDPETIKSACLRCGKEHDPGCIINQAHLRATGESIQL